MKCEDKLKICKRKTEQTCACQGGRGSGGRMVWEFGISRCKLLCTEWINNKLPWYPAGNYIQHLVIYHNKKDYEKMYMRTHV